MQDSVILFALEMHKADMGNKDAAQNNALWGDKKANSISHSYNPITLSTNDSRSITIKRNY